MLTEVMIATFLLMIAFSAVGVYVFRYIRKEENCFLMAEALFIKDRMAADTLAVIRDTPTREKLLDLGTVPHVQHYIVSSDSKHQIVLKATGRIEEIIEPTESQNKAHKNVVLVKLGVEVEREGLLMGFKSEKSVYEFFLHEE